MNKLTIGIPKALLYYKYKDLWINFFENLGLNVIISPNTNKEILENGKKYCLDEACLSLKIYMGHVDYLKDKCDYILVPRISTLNVNEKVCTNFMCLYDLISNTFDKSIIHYNVDVEKKEDEEYAFITMGLNLGFTYRKTKNAYKKAKEYEKNINDKRISKQINKLTSDKNKKILLAGHPYNLYDNLIGGYITNYLEKENVEILYSDNFSNKYYDKINKEISPRNYYTYNKELIGSIFTYKNLVDGIILITSFPCGPDSLTNEIILRSIDVPIINLLIDEQLSDNGIITRLESFLDIIDERKKEYEQSKNY